jgi:hypothetical protein
MICVREQASLCLRRLLEHDRKIPGLNRELHFWQIVSYFATGAGTILATQNYKLWVALTVTIVASMHAIISFKFLEVRIAALNKSQTELQNLILW